jgi:hypothetical protein
MRVKLRHTDWDAALQLPSAWPGGRGWRYAAHSFVLEDFTWLIPILP